MNSKIIAFFMLIAAASASPLYQTVSLGVGPAYYRSFLPVYNYYRVASLPFDQYPPGVDPLKCPNYPYCGTDAGSVIVPSLPSVPTVVGSPTLVDPIANLPAVIDPTKPVDPVIDSTIVEPSVGLRTSAEPIIVDGGKPLDTLKIAPIAGFPGYYIRRLF